MILPDRCYSRSRYTNTPILILYGEMGYIPIDCHISPEDLNRQLGVTKEQEEAMFLGCTLGWDFL